MYTPPIHNKSSVDVAENTTMHISLHAGSDHNFPLAAVDLMTHSDHQYMSGSANLKCPHETCGPRAAAKASNCSLDQDSRAPANMLCLTSTLQYHYRPAIPD